MQKLRAASNRIRQKKHMTVAMVSVPSVALLDKKGDAYSPVRTNYFPHAQVLLGTIVKRHAESRNLPVDVKMVDLKSVRTKPHLTEYGEIDYGGKTLTKHIAGNGLERVGELADCDVIGMTANFTMEANSVAKTIAEIRHVNPDALVVIGGKDASARPAYYRRIGADVVAIGDADRSFPQLIESLMNGAVKAGGILLNGARKKIKSIPLLDFSLLHDRFDYGESASGNYGGALYPSAFGMAAYFETSRGCSGSCDFCTEARTRRSDFDLDLLKRMAEHYKSEGAELLLFNDDNLLQRIRRENGERELIEFFRFLRSLDLAWEFSVGVELGMLSDNRGRLREELIDAMFKNEDAWQKTFTWDRVIEGWGFVGASRLLAPLENLGGGEYDIKKLLAWEKEKEILRKLIGMGVPQINLGIMLGFPHDGAENISQIKARIKELEEIRLEANERNRTTRRLLTAFNHSLFCVMPLPGTSFYEKMRVERRIKYDIEKDPELWNVFTSVIIGDNFAPERITQLRRDIIEGFGSPQPDGKIHVTPVIGARPLLIGLERPYSDNWNVM